jgi:dienelactone hydrolase
MTKHPITEQRLVVEIPQTNRVSVEREIPFGREISEDLRFDIYRPAQHTQSELPAVIFVVGFSDVGGREFLGCNLKDLPAYMDWARLLASSGVAAITYSNVDPVRDAAALVEHIQDNAEALGIDRQRLGIWSCSGNASVALALLRKRTQFKCAALCYGYMIDKPGYDEVASAAAQFGFVKGTASMQISDIADVPILVVRAGRDEMPGLNTSLDRFVAEALVADLPVSLINHASGAHAFDLSEQTEEARQVVRQISQFLTLRLCGS